MQTSTASSEIECTMNPSATAPAYPQPTAVEDLQKRLAVLRDAKVREYHDGPLRISFERPQRVDDAEMIERLSLMAQEERIANGG